MEQKEKYSATWDYSDNREDGMKYVYTAVLEQEEGRSLTAVHFPDLPGCQTCGDDFHAAINMARDVLCFHLFRMERDNKPIPVATSPQDIKLKSGEYIAAIAVDTEDYRRIIGNKAVKKTLTIPTWLNQRAIAANINFSKTLQKALKEELQITTAE